MSHMTWDGSDLLLTNGGPVTLDWFDVTIDLDDFGTVLGIELLGALYRYPGMARHLPDSLDGAEVSVDEEADAMYFKFPQNKGDATRQEPRLAALAVGSDDELLALRVLMES